MSSAQPCTTSVLQVTRRILNFEGMQVVRHVAREFAALETQYKLRYSQAEGQAVTEAAHPSAAGAAVQPAAGSVGGEERGPPDGLQGTASAAHQ